MALKSLTIVLTLFVMLQVCHADIKKPYCIEDPMFAALIKSAMLEAVNNTADQSEDENSQGQWLSNPTALSKFVKFADSIQAYVVKIRTHMPLPSHKPKNLQKVSNALTGTILTISFVVILLIILAGLGYKYWKKNGTMRIMDVLPLISNS